jgi:hypothetical protein
MQKIENARFLLEGDGVNFDPKSGASQLLAGASPELVASVRAYEELRKKYFGGFMGDKRRNLVKRVGYDSKNASHLIRLLRMSVEFLGTGEFKVKRTGLDAEELLDIKRGNWPIEQVKQHAQELFAQARETYEKSTLPEEADSAAAEMVTMEIISSNLSSRLSEYE